jgi:hypothetical protein
MQLEFAGVVMVNSTNPDYFAEAKSVADRYGWMCIGSESNGRPGKGKNACLSFFHNYDHGYDYMLLIDGDDILYPTAFGQLVKLCKFNPDVVGLQTNDIIERVYREEARRVQLTHNSWLYSWFDEQQNWHEKYADLSSYSEKLLGQVITPDRIILISKKAAGLLQCSEKLPVYEDLVMSLYARYYSKMEQITYINTSDTYIYVYDKTNDSSVCKEYDRNHNGDWSAYDAVFRDEIKDIDQVIQNTHAKDVTFIQCAKPTDFDTDDKKQFCISNLI